MARRWWCWNWWTGNSGEGSGKARDGVATGNYRAVIAYDGTEYSGFQVQADQRTIQGELERALQRLSQGFVRVHGAGRTDAGVHAQAQVISFRADWAHGPEALQRAMNAVLPQDIAVRELSGAEEGFHARYSASGRVYLYSIYHGQVRSPLWQRFAHHVAQPLDLAAMNEAARFLWGRQDFAAFGQPPCGENTVRTMYRAGWQVPALGQGWSTGSPPLWQFEIEADAFLRGMVRRIVGTLLAVGRGELTPPGLAEILASRDISRARASVPACGLCLWQVYYRREGVRSGGAW